MIQRIQSVYLLLVAVLSYWVLFGINVWMTNEGIGVTPYAILSDSSWLLKMIPLMFFASGVLASIAIFLYKNRQLQFVVGRIIILIQLFLLGLLIYLSLNLPGETFSEKGIGMFFPVVLLVLTVLANKAIRKDENLVKSVDRLR